MTINEFRILKIDNNKLYNFDENWNKISWMWDDKTILNYIKSSLKNEFYDIIWRKLEFKDLNYGIKWKKLSKILTFTFAWTKKDDSLFPDWFNFLDIVSEDNLKKQMVSDFINIKSSILSVLKYDDNYYIISFWNWHHSFSWLEIIDEDYWIILWKRLITKEWKTRWISQSVIQWDLESTYKTIKNSVNYDSMSDLSNLWKVTKWLSWLVNSEQVFEKNPILKKLHVNIESNKWIKFKFTQAIDQRIFILFFKWIHKVYKDNNDSNSYKLPDLQKIDNKSDKHLNIKNAILNNIVNTSNIYFSYDLFYNYLFDNRQWNEIISFEIKSWEDKIIYNLENNWPLYNLNFFDFLKNNWFNFSNINYAVFSKIVFYDNNLDKFDTRKLPKLSNLLQWEIEYRGVTYLFQWESIFKPNSDFKALVESEFNDKIKKYTINDTNFMYSWSVNWYIKNKKYEEDWYNLAHDKALMLDYNKKDSSCTHIWKDYFYCLDKWVDMTYWIDGIEVCDLIKYDWKELYFIHVKKSHWSSLRNLFSQGKVWTLKILNNIPEAIKHIKVKKSVTIKQHLLDLKKFHIVYAIKNSKTTPPFTLYAQYDFIWIVEYLHQKWIDNINIYMIS